MGSSASIEAVRPARVPWASVLLLGLVPCLIATVQLGRIHPDEVYQWLEPAYFRAHGYGVLAWEWRVGLRNWAGPILFSWLLRLSTALGLTDPRAYRAVLEIPIYGLHVAMLAAVYRYARRRVDGPAALLSLWVLGLYGMVLLFAGRTLSETFSTAFAVLAFEWLDRPDRVNRHAAFAGAALGLSVVARYGSAVWVVATLVYLAAMRNGRALFFVCLGGGAVAVGLGVLDWVSWGSPFHSMRQYLLFNVLSGQAAARFGREPADYYLKFIVNNMPAWVWVALPWTVVKQRPRIPLALFAAGAYLLAIVLTPHKEDRFLYPALVLISFVSAPGLAGLIRRIPREGQQWLVALAVVAMSVGSYFGASHIRGDEFRAIVQAARGDATGLLIVGDGLWGVGGFFYIGKNIPWVTSDSSQDQTFRRAAANPRVNRAVTFNNIALDVLMHDGFRINGKIGRMTLLWR